jgi:hypothetical protein
MVDQIERIVVSAKANRNNGELDTDRLYEEAFDRALSQCRVLVGEAEPFAANYRIFRRFPASFRKRPRRYLIRMLHVSESLRRRMGARHARN